MPIGIVARMYAYDQKQLETWTVSVQIETRAHSLLSAWILEWFF